MLARLENHSPGILPLRTDDEAAVVMDASDAECNVNDLLSQIQQAMPCDR
jgi:hypothetical protein